MASFHTNPYTCGVARFNVSLASSLNSKVSSLASASTSQSGKILLSIKLQEIDDAGKVNLEKILSNSRLTFDVFLHASEGSDLENRLLKRAQKVFAASAEIGEEIKSRRPDVVNLFAPGAPISAVSKHPAISLFPFVMAHTLLSTFSCSSTHLPLPTPLSLEISVVPVPFNPPNHRMCVEPRDSGKESGDGRSAVGVIMMRGG